MQNNLISTWNTSLYGSQTSPVDMCIQNSVPCLPLELLVSMGHNPLLWFCAFNTATFGTLLHVSMCPKPHLWFCAWTTASLASEYLGSMCPSPHQRFCMHNSHFWTRITSLYWSHTSTVVLCKQYRVNSTRINCLYGSQPSFVVIACKTETIGPKLHVSMCPRPHLSFCACKTAWLLSELLDSIGPSPPLWFMEAKQRLLDRNNKSLRDPDMTCRFVHTNHRD